MRSLGSFAGAFAAWAAVGLVAWLLLGLAALALAGDRSLVVLSGSMRPALEVGDVTVNEPITPREARPGDVVTFADPQHVGRLLTHRVVATEPDGDKVAFETRGDANATSETWRIAQDGTMARLSFTVPKLGYALWAAGHPLGRVVAVVLPVLLLVGLLLRRIWHRPPGAGGQERPAAGHPVDVWTSWPAAVPASPGPGLTPARTGSRRRRAASSARSGRPPRRA